ncbi:MAG: hypothetical protein KF711_00350 [Nitrospira sp.]|nr:hypothetical protein [Nitrospira sp.]MBX3369610.1 hypothetical protein [Nitrospira sp.]
MNMWRGLTIAVMVMGATVIFAVPGGAAEKESMEKTPKVEDDASDKSAAKASKDKVIKKRRSSGKSNAEDTTDAKSQPKSQESREGTPGTTLMFRSDGAGNSGAAGK